VLRVGTYVTQLDGLDLHNATFQAELYLWTLWSGSQQENPSDDLAPLNGVYDGDLSRFELLRRERRDGLSWSLYGVRDRFIHRWRLDSYPFDSHLLQITVGFRHPLRRGVVLEADVANSGISPTLYLYGWHLQEAGVARARFATLSNLGHPSSPPGATDRAEGVVSSMELRRQSRLYLLPDFLGYMLAIGLCVLALLIRRTRDDLILAAVVSAAGNYVYLAGILPVGAMSGFIGQLQLVILAGILYVALADEVIDHQLQDLPLGWLTLLRAVVLPSYLFFTMLAIYLIIPVGVVSGP
jgi:hypothetical protein